MTFLQLHSKLKEIKQIKYRCNHVNLQKDHKLKFLNNPKVCLLNSAKNKLGRISTNLHRINASQRNLIKVNQWKDNGEVTEWFENIGNKQQHKYILYNIKDVYPTITKDLLTKCLKFPEKISNSSNF